MTAFELVQPEEGVELLIRSLTRDYERYSLLSLQALNKCFNYWSGQINELPTVVVVALIRNFHPQAKLLQRFDEVFVQADELIKKRDPQSRNHFRGLKHLDPRNKQYNSNQDQT